MNVDRTGCEDCPVGQYGLIDDREIGETYFSKAMARSEHPNTLMYGGHGTVCARCKAGEEPQRGNVTNHSVTGATGCLSCEAIGNGLHSADGLHCVACPDGKYANGDRSGCLACPDGFAGVGGDSMGVCRSGF